MRLGETVAALETIRLNLLRLHVGTGSIEGLTTHLDLAEELSRQAERLIAARAEIDPILPEPRQALATPT